MYRERRVRSFAVLGLVLIATGCGPDEQPPAVSEAASIPDDSFIEVNGTRLHCLDWGGEGDLLLPVPGIGVTARAWNLVAPHFKDRFRVIAVTRREHALSARRGSTFDMDTLADDLADVIAAFSDDPAIVVGWSWAGRELPVLARRHAERVKALVFVDALSIPEGKPSGVPDPPARGYAFMPAWTPQGSPSDRPDSLAMQRFSARGVLVTCTVRGHSCPDAADPRQAGQRRGRAIRGAGRARGHGGAASAVPRLAIRREPARDPDVLIEVLEPFLESQRARTGTR